MLKTRDFNEAIIAAIRSHYPKALSGDIEQSSQCASDISIALGAILAQSFRLNGEVIGRTVLDTIFKRIIENAATIHPESGDQVRTAIHNLPKPH